MVKNSIVLVPFPFGDLSANKVRPALCLTSTIGEYEEVIIAFITSKVHKQSLTTDILIQKETQDWIGTGLSVDSVIHLHKIVTISKEIIKRKLGEININTEIMIKRKLLDLFMT